MAAIGGGVNSLVQMTTGVGSSRWGPTRGRRPTPDVETSIAYKGFRAEIDDLFVSDRTLDELLEVVALSACGCRLEWRRRWTLF